MKDVIIIGAGLAGLSAGWYLRNKDILILESDSRVGGRIHSEKRGYYWLNWGGHVFAGENSPTDKLLKEVNVEARNVPGSLKSIAMNGKLLLDGKVEKVLYKVPMSWNSRFALCKAGIKVLRSLNQYKKALKRIPGENYWTYQQRVFNFLNDQSFTEFVGKLPEDADALFRPTVSRSAGDPEDVSAGAGIGYFNLVLSKSKSAGLTRNIVGGASVLPETIAEKLGEKVQLNANVVKVFHKEDYVVVEYYVNGELISEMAKYAVITTPAPITDKIGIDLDVDMKNALRKIVYGPYVSAAFLTKEEGPQLWDNIYAMATPKKSFNVAFNMANLVRDSESERKKGSSFMTFSPATLAKNLFEKTDEEIIKTYLKDLNSIFPNFEDIVIEAHAQKWLHGLPYCFPGRAKIQEPLTKPSGKIYLAGDYLGTFYTDTAIETGEIAANEILTKLLKESNI
ncbi:NAD(P)/FAD-dependent oxidoreductase [Metasolibacillus sp. FSL H7-0170]|uniref:protoporphyrinogen/coproporphyrinogen oxidase n=1 Tax=Metasolibacillus sp. FSL H7-0170 TaxID=2921431 RepID=UPI0031580AE0